MGLDYLNKKVWHPGSLKNIQKVWQAQQDQIAINKRYKQKLKKLQQQQHNEQMKRIQVEAGLIPRSHLERMDWMYDWGNKIQQQQKTSQQFLLGKKVVPGKKQMKHIFQQQATNRKCEDFVLLHEDPMYQIQKQQRRQRQALMSNPTQMKNIIKQVQQDYLKSYMGDEPEKSDKKHKKNKKDKKHKHKHKSEKRSRSRSKDKKKHRSSKRQHSSSSRSRSSSHSSSQQDRTTKQSKVYQQYLKQRFGGVLKQDQHGNLKPDYNRYKSKYRTQAQLDDEQRKNRLQKLRQNSKKLDQIKGNYRSQDFEIEEQQQHHAKKNFDQGVGNLRKDMFTHVKQNRNLKKYKNRSDSE